MAVTILQRPEGYLIDQSTESQGATDSTSGDIIINYAAHGLIDGDVIYIASNIGDYNGFWTVDQITVNTFKLLDPKGGFVQFHGSSQFVFFYHTSLTHGWSCVHLPITYRLSNDRYPTNSVDTSRTVTGLSNYSGFARVDLSGSLGTFEELSFVKISNAPNSDLDGVYQIIDKVSTSSVLLNLSYSSVSNAAILGASMQLHYANYNIVVKVYAGINSNHEWTAQKPYELAATLELIPDENNQVFFSVNDILKAYVKTENNLLLGTLPNNIDAWTNFYISTAESYDTSNGYSVTTLESSFTSDQSNFEGTAVNAMLPFKNIYSGHLSEYLMTNNTAKFLTLFTIPVLFSCGDDTPECYSDISFLNPYNDISLTVKKQFYLNGNAGTLVSDVIVTDSGVIRTELEADCDYDRVDLSIIQELSLLGLASWSQTASGTRTWVIDADPSCSLISATSSYLLHAPLRTILGEAYTINYNLTNSTGADADVNFEIGFLNASFVSIQNQTGQFDNATESGSFNFVATGNGYYLYIKTSQTDVGATTVTVNSISLVQTSVTLSETKQFKIDCGCSNQEIRLTWLNNLGGFDYWKFTGETDHTIDITASGETRKNIFHNWPKSYGEDADTIKRQTFRESSKREFIFSQQLTRDEADALAYIKSSPLVQIINSRNDRRTVLVDTDSFSKYKDGDKTYLISFSILYTDDIPSQRV